MFSFRLEARRHLLCRFTRISCCSPKSPFLFHVTRYPRSVILNAVNKSLCFGQWEFHPFLLTNNCSSNDVVHKTYCEYQITVQRTDVEISRAENGYRNDSAVLQAADQVRFPTGVLSSVRRSTNSSPSASTLPFIPPPTAIVTFTPRTVVPLGAASSRCSHQSRSWRVGRPRSSVRFPFYRVCSS